MLRLLCLLPVFIVPFTVALAGETVTRPGVLHVSLESAIRMALAKNFSIQVERFEPQIARERITSELGRFDPKFDISATRGEVTRRDPLLGDISRNVARTDDLSTGIGGLTPWGLTYDFGLGSRNLTGTAGRFDDNFSSKGSFSLRQPLLRGFGTDVNLAQVRIARTNALVSEWQLRQRVIDIVTQTTFVFNELHLAHENLEVANRSRALALQLLTDNERRAEIGVMSPLNVTTARAEAAARQEDVILAQRQVKDNENFIKQLVTNDMESMLSTEVSIVPPRAPAFTVDVRAGIKEALELRPDYRQAVLDLQRRNISLVFAKNQALPQLDLVGSLDLLGIDENFGTSVRRIGNRDETAWTAGAIFSVPIPNREGRGNLNAARLSSAQGLVTLQRLEQQIVVDVDNASGQIVTGRQRIASTSEARALAKESLDASGERLRAGTGTTFEVLELQKRLAEAEAAEVRARADYNKAVSEYHRQTGTTLRIHGVIVE